MPHQGYLRYLTITEKYAVVFTGTYTTRTSSVQERFPARLHQQQSDTIVLFTYTVPAFLAGPLLPRTNPWAETPEA